MEAISVISIPVADPQLAKAFFLKIGFTLITEADMGDGNKWIQLGLADQLTSITLVNWYKHMPPGSLHGLVISSHDIEAEVQEFKAKGVDIGNIDNTPWGRFATFYDLDRNSFILHQA